MNAVEPAAPSNAWTHRVKLDLDQTANDPRNARNAVAGCLRADGVVEHCIDEALLGTSELVTNAVLHGTPPSTLNLFTTAGLFRVEVADANLRPPPTLGTGGLAEGGRGLFLVAELATSWGWELRSSEKVVWFEGLAELD